MFQKLLAIEEEYYYYEDDENYLSETELWWLGALIYVTGSILINLGSNFIRHSHELIKGIEESQRPPIWKRYWWLSGFGIFAIGNIFNFCGFMFGSQSMLVALGSIQFISNVIFANFINDEQITFRAVIATVIIILGDVVAVMYGSKSNETYSLEDLYDLLFEPLFIAYFILLTISVIVLQLSYLYCKYKLIPSGRSNSYVEQFIPFAYAAVSAMIGTTSVTLGKSLSGIVSQAIGDDGWDQFATPWPYLIFLVFFIITIFWLYRMNNALKLYDALFIIPTLQGMWLLFAILGGGIFFQEYESMSLHEIAMFFSGLFILLTGVAALAPSTSVKLGVMDKIEVYEDEELMPLNENPISNLKITILDIGDEKS